MKNYVASIETSEGIWSIAITSSGYAVAEFECEEITATLPTEAVQAVLSSLESAISDHKRWEG